MGQRLAGSCHRHDLSTLEAFGRGLSWFVLQPVSCRSALLRSVHLWCCCAGVHQHRQGDLPQDPGWRVQCVQRGEPLATAFWGLFEVFSSCLSLTLHATRVRACAQSYGIKVGYGSGAANQAGAAKVGEEAKKTSSCC